MTNKKGKEQKKVESTYSFIFTQTSILHYN